MKTTFTSKQGTVEKCLKNVWQPLPIIAFTLFFGIISTSHGGHLLAGDSDAPASRDKSEGDYDYTPRVSFQMLQDVAIQPTIEWDKTLGGSDGDFLYSAVPTPDGGYLLGGYSRSNASGDKSENPKGGCDPFSCVDYWVVKIDALGNKEWDKTLGGNDHDVLSSAIPTPDGGYLLAGYSDSDASGDKSEDSKGFRDYWVVKIDAQGNKVWDKTLGGNSYDFLSSAIPTPDGGYLLAGYSNSDASGDKSEDSKNSCEGCFYSDYWIIKIDAQGNKVWDKTLGGNSSDGLSSAILTPDGGYLLAGTSSSNASGDKSENPKGGCGTYSCDDDYWIVKVDAQGNKVWDKTLGGNNLDRFNHLIPTPDGGYLLAGYSYSPASEDKSEPNRGNFGFDYWIVKIDAQGNKVWDKTLGGSDDDELHTAISTPDGGYLLGGFSRSDASGDKSENSKGDEDYWIVKLKDQSTPVVTSLTLIDAKTDQEIRELKDRDVISLAEVGSEVLNIRAYTFPEMIGRVEFALKGPVSYSRTEQVFPYALFGDIEGDYEGKSLLTGKYVLTVTPYSKNEKGTAFTVFFQVIKEAIVVQPTLEWDKTLGGKNGDRLSSALPTPDGGYLLAGSSKSDASGDKSENGKGGSDYWVVKIDALGNKVWDKTLGGSDDDELHTAIPTSDGGYLLAGSSESNASGDKSENPKGGCDLFSCDIDYWVIKIDALGNKEWDKTLGGSDGDYLHSVVSTPDGGYLLAGYSYSPASGDKSEKRKGGCDEYGICFSDYWIVKIDALGNKEWDKTLGGSDDDYFQSAIPTLDGGYLLAGSSYSDASGDKSEDSKDGCEGCFYSDYWVIKIDALGNKEWDKTFSGSDDDYLNSAISTPDGGYLLAGDSQSDAWGDKSENSKGYYDYWVVKIDALGNKVWDKTLGGSDDEGLSSTISTPDGGYLLGGSSNSNASGDKSENRKGDCDEYGNCFSDYWVVKIDALGNTVWDKTLGGSGDEGLRSAILTPDGGYLLTGSSESNASGDKSENRKGGCDEYGNCDSDYWIVKIKVENTPTITSLSLIDAATDQEIKELNDGDGINLAEAGSGLLNIRANTSGPIDHVYLKLQGPVRVNRTEREFPYALFGDMEGDYEGNALLAGKYILTVTPYGGIVHTISFEVTDAPEATARQVKVYPVPTSGVINILHEGKAEEAHLMLLDFNGNMLLHQPLSQQPVEQVDLSAFKKGTYYLRVVSPEGVQVFRVAKE